MYGEALRKYAAKEQLSENLASHGPWNLQPFIYHDLLEKNLWIIGNLKIT